MPERLAAILTVWDELLLRWGGHIFQAVLFFTLDRRKSARVRKLIRYDTI
jgi:hypothetical protein